MVALGTNLSALWILIANGWMQNPVGAEVQSRHDADGGDDFKAVMFNPVAQAKFVHTVSAGYVCAAVFVLGISASTCCAGARQRSGQAFDDGRRRLRPGLVAVGGRAGRRERLRPDRQPENEARRAGGRGTPSPRPPA
jgi:hypothetical protein